MSRARYLIGDVRDVLATLPDGSVDFVMTSPPFLKLRSYLPADHPDKHREIGGEPDPASFIDTLLGLTAELGRVLADHGSIAVELGDTYAGGGQGPDARYTSKSSQVLYNPTARGQHGGVWPDEKSKALIPEVYRIGLAYGINPLTGRPSPAGRWRVRNVITWCRPNPPVGALSDKYRPATSDLVVATRSKGRWFDMESVRGPEVEAALTRVGAASASKGISGGDSGNPDKVRITANPNGAPPNDYWDVLEGLLAIAPKGSDRERARWVRDRLDDAYGPSEMWEIPPGGYEGAHFAVYPPELCRIPIDSMCPIQVCTTCGEPRRRIIERESTGQNTRTSRGVVDDPRQAGAVISTVVPDVSRSTTVGWTDCGHGTWRAGVVLDPFAGSGTTLMCATGMGRDAIGIDFDARNADLAYQRIGMFLDVEDLRPVPIELPDAVDLADGE